MGNPHGYSVPCKAMVRCCPFSPGLQNHLPLRVRPGFPGNEKNRFPDWKAIDTGTAHNLASDELSPRLPPDNVFPDEECKHNNDNKKPT